MVGEVRVAADARKVAAVAEVAADEVWDMVRDEVRRDPLDRRGARRACEGATAAVVCRRVSTSACHERERC